MNFDWTPKKKTQWFVEWTMTYNGETSKHGTEKFDCPWDAHMFSLDLHRKYTLLKVVTNTYTDPPNLPEPPPPAPYPR